MSDTSPSVPKRRHRWLFPLLIALAAYCATLAVRMGDLPKWNYDALRVDGEYIMATHDAYAWLAGAYGVGTGAGTPLARMARAYADFTGRPAGEFAFFSPAVASSLVAVAVVLWAWTLGGVEAGLGAGFLAALAPGFYFRTRLGYYDTDMATLLFPLLQAWMVAHWLAPHLCRPLDVLRGHREAEEESDPAPSLAWPFVAGLLVRLGGADWHARLPDYNLLVAVAAGGLTLLLSRPSLRSRLLWGETVLVLAGFFGNAGLLAAGGLNLLFRYAPRYMAPTLARPWPSVVVLTLVLALAGLNRGIMGQAEKMFAAYSKSAVEVVGETSNQSQGPVIDGTSGEAPGPPPVYPGITQSVVEAQAIPMEAALSQVILNAWLTGIGLIGFAVVAILRPTAFFLLPMAVLALLSPKLGVRMTMFGGPVAALGLTLPLVWGLRCMLHGRAWKHWATLAVSAGFAVAAFVPYLNAYVQYPPTPILAKPHVVALRELSRIAPPGSRVWTWWDWGYATQYYSRCMTFADGARHSGEYLFPLALALTTPYQLQCSQVIAYSALLGGTPWQEWSKHSAAAVGGFLGRISTDRFVERPREKQYLVVAWENLRLAYWITYYGTWDIVRGQGRHGFTHEVAGNIQVDAPNGFMIGEDGQKVPLATMDVVGPKGREFSDLRRSGAHLVINDSIGKAMVLDDVTYQSMMVQLLLAAPDSPQLKDNFRLVYDGFPLVRIYEVL